MVPGDKDMIFGKKTIKLTLNMDFFNANMFFYLSERSIKCLNGGFCLGPPLSVIVTVQKCAGHEELGRD